MRSENDTASTLMEAPFWCSCGSLFPAHRWVRVDIERDAAQVAQVRAAGPFAGSCPTCGDPAAAVAPWVAVAPSREAAWLVIPSERRGETLEAMRWHLDVVERSAGVTPGWLLSPRPVLDDRVSSTPPWEGLAAHAHAQAHGAEAEEPAGVPVVVGTELSGVTEVGELSAHVGEVEVDGNGDVRVRVFLDREDRAHWGTAALSVRPIHLRNLGFPVLGVRVLASYLGRVSVIDGVLDPSDDAAGPIIERLCRDFRVFVELDGGDGSSSLVREVSIAGLNRNAALCLESARGLLAAGDHPPSAWPRALERLASMGVSERLAPAEVQIGAGDYQFIVSAEECWAALEHLDAVSSTANLAHLLEVDGMPVGEFEQLRRRILAQSISFGLCAPRRFWRRVIASGLCESPARYVEALLEARLGASGDEEEAEALCLSPEVEAEVWSRVMSFCDARGLEVPDVVYESLGLEPEELRQSGSATVSGTIGHREQSQVWRGLDDPRRRVQVASDLLLSHDDHDLGPLITAMDGFGEDELIRLLPPMVVAARAHRDEMLSGLASSNPHLRQAVVICLGEAEDRNVVAAMTELLTAEPSEIWRDAATALGRLGPAGVTALVVAMEASPAPARIRCEQVLRVAGQAHGADLVAELCSHESSEVRAAASRALVTLGEQHDATDASDPILRFSRRARLRLDSTEGMKVAPDPTQVLTISDLEIL